jgi:hypothetical protein
LLRPLPILDPLEFRSPLEQPGRPGAGGKEERMDTAQLLAQLYDYREKIDRVIAAAEDLARGGAKRRGRPPKWMQATGKRRGRPPGSKNKPTAPIQMNKAS